MKIRPAIAYLGAALALVVCTPSTLETAPPVREMPAGPIPADLFGLHFVAAWASPATLPTGTALLRLHGATPRWHELHTAPGQWYDEPPPVGKGLGRIDALVLFAERNAPDARLIYVIGGGGHTGGGFPDWTHPGIIADAWREHVRYLASRYRFDVWEIWNEADSGYWYTGSTALLVELTKIASEVIREADPEALIAGPSFTESGHAMMREFYLMLPPGTVDIAAWHHGVTSPERDTVNIIAAKRIAGRLPLWLTEYNVAGGASELMRTLLVHHLYGVDAAIYYSWEMPSYGSCCPGTFAHTTDSAGELTEAGHAYIAVRDWLVGRTVEAWSAERGQWSITLDDGRVVEWSDSTMPVRR